jgi:translocation and assembly module TamB
VRAPSTVAVPRCLAGALDFDLNSTGEWPESGPAGAVQTGETQGKLRSRPIAGAGDITLARDLRPAAVQLHPAAQLEAAASQAPDSHIAAKLRIAALEEWQAGLRGAPSIDAKSQGAGRTSKSTQPLKPAAYAMPAPRSIRARLTLNARDPKAPKGQLRLTAHGLKLAGFEFDDASLALEGDAHAHRIELDARANHCRWRSQRRCRRSRVVWHAPRGAAPSGCKGAGAAIARKPAHVVVSRSSTILITPALRGGDISLCLAGRHTGQEFAVDYSVTALPLAMLTALAAPTAPVSVEGILEGKGDLRRTVDGTISGQARLTSASGAIAQGEGKDTLRLAYRDFSLDANLSHDSGKAQLHGTLVDQGVLEGSLSVAVRERDPTLAGKASIELRDLAPLAWWMPQLAQMRGTGALSAEVSGTMNQPHLAFTVTARDLDAEVPLLGLQLKQGHISVKHRSDGAFGPKVPSPLLEWALA